MTELPSLSQEAMTTLQQIELIKNLNLKPDIIINIKVSCFSTIVDHIFDSGGIQGISSKIQSS